jgi:hypothetical protein
LSRTPGTSEAIAAAPNEHHLHIIVQNNSETVIIIVLRGLERTGIEKIEIDDGSVVDNLG